MPEIERLIYTNSAGGSVEFSVKSALHCNVGRDVKGLNDTETELYSMESIGQEGSSFTGYHIKERDIEITGHIKATTKAEERAHRHKLASVMNPEYQGTLTYVCGTFSRKITCRPEKTPQLKGGVFTQFTVALVAQDPCWEDNNETVTEIALWNGGMEFDTEDGLQLTPDWVIGYRSESLIVDVENDGDRATGMVIVIKAQETVVNPGLMNIGTREQVKLMLTMSAGDEVRISTGYGKKNVKLISGSEENDGLRYLTSESVFLQLEPGANELRYFADSGESGMNVTIYHSNRYLGV